MLEKRTAEVLYKKEAWFAWARDVQEEEESNREKEQKKIKQESALFKRHVKNLQARLNVMEQYEEKIRQDAYLEDAYRERMSMSAEESEDDDMWDPIEDMESDKKDRYIDLIKHFLWMEVLQAGEVAPPSMESNNKDNMEVDLTGETQTTTKKGKKKTKSNNGASKSTNSKAGPSNLADAKETAYKGQMKLLAMQQNKQNSDTADLPDPDKKNIETEQEMRKRLSRGEKKIYDSSWGWQLVGTFERPHETHERTAPMTNDEIESLVKDIREIKLLLFCRLLLAQASLLPAALRASSVEEFLNDANVAESDLRDLCIKVEEPTLQVIRDACADFARGDEADEDMAHVDDADDDELDCETFEDMLDDNTRYKHLHTKDWLREQMTAKEEKRLGQKKTKARKIKVTICGKTIWNHASEKAMSRDGWLQFSVIAKDCDLADSVKLCRNWAEFSDLNLLALWDYFPTVKWSSWASNKFVQQLQELSFFPYFMDLGAQKHSRHNQVSGRSQGRRQHDIIETRNVIVRHMKRNDPITRRFLQYLVMRSGYLLVLVRDGKTGRVITAPPEEHLWTYRRKQGIGRASKNEWVNVLEVGPHYFEMTDALRKWQFGFDDYYDVVIWDLPPDQPPMEMYNLVISELLNAWRITSLRGIYTHMEPILRTLTREKDSMRTRQIKPGEKVESLWDQMMNERNHFVMVDIDNNKPTTSITPDISTSQYEFYNEANVVEDKVLFPEDPASNKENTPFREIRNGVSRIESGLLPSTARYLKRGMESFAQGGDPLAALMEVTDNLQGNIWALPNIWETAIKQALKEKCSDTKCDLIKRTGLDNVQESLTYVERMYGMDPMQIMERDRSFEFKSSFHAGDLEPGSDEKYSEVQGILDTMLKHKHSGPTDWVWLIADILDWLDLQVESDDYAMDHAAPWPHDFIVHDMVRAFAATALFFPGLEVTSLVTKFMNSDQCESSRNSLLFNPKERGKTKPDRRSRTSYRHRGKDFWKDFHTLMEGPKYFTEAYPFDWSLAIRPIIAHLYRAGIIAPAYFQSDRQIVPGLATANTEPHRPGKLDLFINYEDKYNNCPQEFPPKFIDPDKFPVLLHLAQSFAKTNNAARFAFLRLWSAPHFYPLMVGPQTRLGTSFLDSTGRSWQWKFLPKDMAGSEYSSHFTTGRRLDLLQKQFGKRVVNSGDSIIVMANDSEELLRTCIAVTFAMQMKPWLREVDLWKSFIDVDLEFLEQLDAHWWE